jgi:hypothetical protein
MKTVMHIQNTGTVMPMGLGWRLAWIGCVKMNDG